MPSMERKHGLMLAGLYLGSTLIGVAAPAWREKNQPPKQLPQIELLKM